jgi:hypothetical protein
MALGWRETDKQTRTNASVLRFRPGPRTLRVTDAAAQVAGHRDTVKNDGAGRTVAIVPNMDDLRFAGR